MMSDDNEYRRGLADRSAASVLTDESVFPKDQTSSTAEVSCPAWCTTTHGQLAGADGEIHVGGALQVRGTILRLCSAAGQEPYLLVGDGELTLYQAEALMAALAQLIDMGHGKRTADCLSRAGLGTPTPGP